MRGKCALGASRVRRTIALASVVVPLWGSTLAYGRAVPLYWDGDGAAPGGGAGSWNTTSLNWNTQSDFLGTYVAWNNSNNDDAVFGVTPGLVFVSAPVTANTLTFDVGGYNLLGPSAITRSASDVTVNAGVASILTTMAGTSGLNKLGPGTLFLRSGSTYTGNSTVSNGTVAFDGDTAFGTAPAAPTPGAIVLNGGALRSVNSSFAGSFAATNRGIDIQAGSGTFDVPDVTQIMIYNGAITGTGKTFVKTGRGEFRTQTTTGHSFTKLLVLEGLYRVGVGGVETGYGATPASFLPDQITLNGGSLGSTDTRTLSVNRGITIGANGGTFTQLSGITLTVPGAVSGSGALNKFQIGTVVLQADSTGFTGSTNLIGGTLALSGSAGALNSTSAVNFLGGELFLDNGGTLSPANRNTRLNDSAPINMYGGVLRINNSSTASTPTTETVGTLTIGAGANIVGATATSTANVTQLAFTGGLTRSSSDRGVVVFRGTSLGANTIASQTANTSNISFTDTANVIAQLVGNGMGSTDIPILPFALGDTAGTNFGRTFVTYTVANGMVPLADTAYASTLAADQNVSLGAAPAPATVAINSLRATGTTAFSIGLGTHTLTITSGAILSNNSGAAPGLTFSSGTLAFGSREAVIGTGSSSGTGSGISTGILINAIISGSNGLTKHGLATVTLGADNSTTLSGTITHNQGTLAIGHIGAVGSGPLALRGIGNLAIGTLSGATTFLFSGLAGHPTFANDISLTSVGAGTNVLSTSVSSQFITLSGQITGGFGTGLTGGLLRFTGPTDDSSGFILTNASNSFAGTVSVFEGQLAFTSNEALGHPDNGIILAPFSTGQTSPINGGLRFDANNITLNRPVQFNTEASINTQGFTAEMAGSNTGTGLFNKLGSGVLILSGSSPFFSGAINVREGKLVVMANDALGSTVGASTFGVGQASTVTLAFKSSTSLEYTTPETLNLAGQGVGGVGVLENISGDNFFAGAINWNGGTNTLGMTGGSLVLRGNQVIGANSLFIKGPGDLTIDGVISGTSSSNPTFGTITKQGSGALTLNGSNTYSGITRVLEGTLRVSSDTNLGAAPASPVADRLTLNGGTLHAISSFTMNSNRGITLGAAGGTFSTPTGVSLTYNGVIAGAGNPLTKIGLGTLALGGTNTYSGLTTISAGTLRIDSPGSIPGNVSIEAAGRLAGNGSVGGSVTVQGTIAAGTSVGQLTTAAQTWAGGGAYEWEISDATVGNSGNGVRWDHLSMTTLSITATSGSKFTIKISSMGAPPANFDPINPFTQTWTIASASGGISGFDLDKFHIDATAFVGAEPGGFFTLRFNMGGDLMVHYVPEPGGAALLVVGMARLLRRRRGA